jgi:hypothetical protein
MWHYGKFDLYIAKLYLRMWPCLTFKLYQVLCFQSGSGNDIIYHRRIPPAGYSTFLSFNNVELSGTSYRHLSYVANLPYKLIKTADFHFCDEIY